MTVHMFDAVHSISEEKLKETLGGKGANLNRMTTTLGLPVPYGFTIEAEECLAHQNSQTLHSSLMGHIKQAVAELENKTGKVFGDKTNPLLLSVRSGAKFSMPGMMETILNVGLTNAIMPGLAKATNEEFAADSYRRLLQMYGTTALDIPQGEFKRYYDAVSEFACGGPLPIQLIRILIDAYKGVYKEHDVKPPTTAMKTLESSVMAVFNSWWGDKAQAYREIENIPDTLGTAVNVQVMVFGNLNDRSGTGVAFTRNPNTGESERYGDFLVNAQGEDVVAGTHQTVPLADMGKDFPKQAKELETIMQTLETEFKDMCDIEFTVENNKLWMLQTRVGKRNPKAAIRIAIELAADGIISPEEATNRLYEAKRMPEEPIESSQAFAGQLLGKGLPASPGRVIGEVVFTSDQAEAAHGLGKKVILVRELTEPSDIKGMAVATGILTAVGGLVSHAAVVARGWGKPCVVGFGELKVSQFGVFTVGDIELTRDSVLCIDGETGEVFLLDDKEKV